MRWPHPYRMPKWILSAAAMGMLTAPSITIAQSGISPATGKPAVKPAVRQASAKSTARTTAPTVPPMEETVQPTAPAIALTAGIENETPVQKELRRLYYESGREAPEVPTPAQMQRINGRSAAQPMTPVPAPQPAYGTNVTVPPRGGVAPAASAPARPTSRNPFVSFFRRITPGSKPVSQPAAPPVAVTQPVPQPAAVAQQTPPPAPARGYAPYSGSQPKRLTEQPARPAIVAATVPVQVPAANAVPATPVNVAEKLQLESTPAAAVPEPVAARVIVPPPTTGPVITGPSTGGSFTPRTSTEPEPVFEEPVIVDADSPEASPFEEPVVMDADPEMPIAAAGSPMPEGEFPEPFPEEGEAKADSEATESPFSGVALEDDPIVAKPVSIEAAPLADAVAEPLPLTAPETNTLVVAAPTTAAIEPEETAKAVPAAPTTSTATEDDEFFPADVAKPTNEPILALPGAPIDAKPTTPATADSAEYAAKMQKIKDRGGMKGLKGFCPVTLRDERELKDAKPEFHSQFRGQKFHFASAEAKAKFDQAPAGYAPAAYGADVVVLIRDKDVSEGTLDFAAWFKGQLYLFSSEETHAVFTADPAKFSAPAGIE